MNMNNEEIYNKIWQGVLKNLQENFSKATFDSVIKDHCSIHSISQNVIYILVSSESIYRMITGNQKDNFVESFENAFFDVTNTNYQIEFINKSQAKNLDKNEVIEKKEIEFFDQSYVRQGFTFDSFIVGPSNNQAYNAAKYILNSENKLHTLFIYADSGLGKTHLLSAIYHEYKKLFPDKKIKYVCVNDFIDVYIKLVREERNQNSKTTVSSLKDYFKKLDCVLFDDVQFLKGKNKSQEVFFDIYENLIKRDAQIIITSDCSPDHIPDIEKRITTRFTQGICCAIRIPEKDTMVNILKKKIEINKLDVDLFDDDALNYLASKNSHNVRELEGALSRLIFYITLNSLYGERITLNVVREAFEDTQPISLSTSKTEKSITMEDITYQVACHFNLTLAQIKSKVRTMQIAYARQIAVYLIRKVLGSPYNEIGKFFDRDHSTIISSCNKINALLSKDENLKKTVEELHRKLK